MKLPGGECGETRRQVLQMYFRSCRIYGSSSTREILNPKHTTQYNFCDRYNKTAESFENSRNSQSEYRYG